MTVAPILPWPLLAAVGLGAIAFTVWSLRPWTLATQRRSPQRRSPRKVRPALNRCVVVVLLLLAALRPGWAGGHAQTSTAELDVFFVVDTSTSMGAEDYNGAATRLSGVQRDVMAIAQELAGAKFSLITFDDKATVRMPLSQDATALQTSMATLQPQNPRYAKGSSVTGAGQLLKERLVAAREQHPGRPALVLYAGDGENTSAAAPSPMDGSIVAGGAVLGYGTEAGGRMKDYSRNTTAYVKDRNQSGGQDAISRIDEQQLRSIAEELNVPYAHRTAKEPVSDMLGKAQPGTLSASTEDAPGRIELYWLLALAALALAIPEPLRHLRALRAVRSSAPKERKG
ncbi:vWA domain-containing protein [Paenarthrobacter sp. JL.01a]|uniref:vWA domain-containing protein n=1 Tax=Paenarthrobacter sp. JL.01a TaxID=2979324 RepID=UPI0021C9886F|nr:VWA domain-containing protein [Paenarthrobacter sp. JL.01a]UXM90037.1 VWA domain-containing protein [Paenarthrobacter sp. JL.01a]